MSLSDQAAARGEAILTTVIGDGVGVHHVAPNTPSGVAVPQAEQFLWLAATWPGATVGYCAVVGEPIAARGRRGVARLAGAVSPAGHVQGRLLLIETGRDGTPVTADVDRHYATVAGPERDQLSGFLDLAWWRWTEEERAMHNLRRFLR